jgi:RNA polymerase sigma-70 factor, ECF subfamily
MGGFFQALAGWWKFVETFPAERSIKGGRRQRCRMPETNVSPAPQLPDDDIRQCLGAQDYPAALELLLPRYRDRVFRLAWSMLRDEATAEDMAQDVFVRVWRALPSFHGEASLSTWIYAITRNRCLTELKRRASRPTISMHDPNVEETLDTIPAMQVAASEAGTTQDVEALLAELPERYRRVLTLFYLEQRKYEEVAEMLGLPMGTVKTFLFRAKRELLKLATQKPAAPLEPQPA